MINWLLVTATLTPFFADGIYFSGATLTVRGCLFANNSVAYGGGLYIEKALYFIILDSIFSGNSANEVEYEQSAGAAIYVSIFVKFLLLF